MILWTCIFHVCLHLIARLFFSEILIFKKVGITSYFCLFFKEDNNHAQKGSNYQKHI